MIGVYSPLRTSTTRTAGLYRPLWWRRWRYVGEVTPTISRTRGV